jgi:hypothetical protein
MAAVFYLAYFVIAGIGHVMQSLYFALGLGRGAEVIALAFIALIVGGAASSVLWLPFVPAALAPAFLLRGVGEGALFLWLLIKGVRRARQ